MLGSAPSDFKAISGAICHSLSTLFHEDCRGVMMHVVAAGFANRPVVRCMLYRGPPLST